MTSIGSGGIVTAVGGHTPDSVDRRPGSRPSVPAPAPRRRASPALGDDTPTPRRARSTTKNDAVDAGTIPPQSPVNGATSIDVDWEGS
jgi:hypothetical protein